MHFPLCPRGLGGPKGAMMVSAGQETQSSLTAQSNEAHSQLCHIPSMVKGYRVVPTHPFMEGRGENWQASPPSLVSLKSADNGGHETGAGGGGGVPRSMVRSIRCWDSRVACP